VTGATPRKDGARAPEVAQANASDADARAHVEHRGRGPLRRRWKASESRRVEATRARDGFPSECARAGLHVLEDSAVRPAFSEQGIAVLERR